MKSKKLEVPLPFEHHGERRPLPDVQGGEQVDGTVTLGGVLPWPFWEPPLRSPTRPNAIMLCVPFQNRERIQCSQIISDSCEIKLKP